MVVRTVVLVVASIVFVIMGIDLVKEEKRINQLEETLVEEVAKKVQSESKEVTLITIKEKELYKAVIKGKSFEVYLNEKEEIADIIEFGKQLEGETK